MGKETIIFKRKIYDKLMDWKSSAAGEKALLIEGARRIGKTTIVREFAENEYESCLFIDFNDASEDVLGYFDRYMNDLDTFFMFLSQEYRVTLHERHSLVVFDEIQRFPKARQAIKRLVADGRYDYIETGSLISIHENVKDITIPSEERSIRMYPMDYEEFAWAMGEEMLVSYIHECWEKKVPLERSLHDRAMLLFREWMLVGGMPRAVSAFISSGYDFARADTEKRDILSLYRADISKIGGAYRSKVLSVFDMIPGFLSKHEKRVVFSAVVQDSFSSQYSDTFQWLADSMMVNECWKCDDPNVGFSLNLNESYVKCYMGDTGLLVSHAFSENELSDSGLYLSILKDKLSLNEGMLYENAVAQMLTACGRKLFFYTHYDAKKKRNDIEIDFLISNHSALEHRICPIEVKSSKRYQFNSLKAFRKNENFRKRTAGYLLIHPAGLTWKTDNETGDRFLAIPPYMTMCL